MATCFFSDIKGFTSLSSQLSSEVYSPLPHHTPAARAHSTSEYSNCSSYLQEVVSILNQLYALMDGATLLMCYSS